MLNGLAQIEAEPGGFDRLVSLVRVEKRRGSRDQKLACKVVFLKGAQVVRLLAILDAGHHEIADERREARLSLEPIAVVAIAAETENAELVRLGRAQRQARESRAAHVTRQPHLGRVRVPVDAVV